MNLFKIGWRLSFYLLLMVISLILIIMPETLIDPRRLGIFFVLILLLNIVMEHIIKGGK